MTTYQELEHQLATDLIDAYPEAAEPEAEVPLVVATSSMMPELIALIDALPYYGDQAWNSTFRSALTNLAASNLPNAKIEAHPFESGFGYSSSFSYDGPYSGYQNAFFTGTVLNSAGAEVLRQVSAVNPGMNMVWWGEYCLALLTDAVRAKVAVALDSAKLVTALSNYNAALLPTLSAAYLAVIKAGFPATSVAYDKIVTSGETATAAAQLTQSIQSPTFIADSNEAMSMGGDSTNAAVWFLYNNWILLKLLGADVDAVIDSAKSAGLNVPAEVGPGVWWNGGANGYTAWFVALSGADITPLTGSQITDPMPEEVTTAYWQSTWPVFSKTSEPNGYSISLTDWGSLAIYKPPPSSCLGAGTGILMADKSVKLIEEIEIGETVWTPSGPHKVALVEQPPRAGRTLTRISGLNIYLTQGHPVRMIDPGGPRYASVGAWTLRDTTPTMTENGVVELEPDVQLMAVTDGEVHAFSVESLEPEMAREDDDNCVYDLLLEDWERHRPAFFAGGPTTFVAVEAESSNPLREPPSTLALLAALEETVDVSRDHVSTPAETLPRSINRLDPTVTFYQARHRGWAYDSSHRLDKPSIPGPDFYMTDGAWEPHASMLEVYLLRRFARSWRRLLACGWRTTDAQRHAKDHLSILVYDLEIVGEQALCPDGQTEVALTILDYGLDFTLTKSLIARIAADKRWHPRFDEIVDFGAHIFSPDAALHVAFRHNSQELAVTYIAITAQNTGQSMNEYFLTAPDGTIQARVALDLCWHSAFQRRAEAGRRQNWSPLRAKATALAWGQELGRDLADMLR